MSTSLPELAWITSEDEGVWDLGGVWDPLGLAPFTPHQATHQLNLIKSDISQGFPAERDGLLSEHKNLLAKGSKQPCWLSQPCCQTLSASAGKATGTFPSALPGEGEATHSASSSKLRYTSSSFSVVSSEGKGLAREGMTGLDVILVPHPSQFTALSSAQP